MPSRTIINPVIVSGAWPIRDEMHERVNKKLVEHLLIIC